MYNIRYNSLKLLALYLGDYRKQIYLREISRLANLPLKTTQNLLSELGKNKVLTSIVRGKNKYFELNLANIETKLLLLQTEIWRTELFLEKYPLFKTFLKELKTNNFAVIFGSFAKFKADKESDLDILVFSKDKYKMPYHLLSCKAHQIILSENNFNKAVGNKEALITEIANNHIILNNHSFYVNIMWEHYGK